MLIYNLVFLAHLELSLQKLDHLSVLLAQFQPMLPIMVLLNVLLALEILTLQRLVLETILIVLKPVLLVNSLIWLKHHSHLLLAYLAQQVLSLIQLLVSVHLVHLVLIKTTLDNQVAKHVLAILLL